MIRRIIRSSEVVMQKGFASAEVIVAALIISLLITVAVPNAAELVDRAAVKYEQKRVYGELQFVRTLNRAAVVSSAGFDTKLTDNNQAMMEIDRTANSYRILRDEKEIRESHYLSNGVTFSAETDVPERIWFDASGYSNVTSKTIVLTSRRGHKAKIIFDSVGRIRGE